MKEQLPPGTYCSDGRGRIVGKSGPDYQVVCNYSFSRDGEDIVFASKPPAKGATWPQALSGEVTPTLCKGVASDGAGTGDRERVVSYNLDTGREQVVGHSNLTMDKDSITSTYID